MSNEETSLTPSAVVDVNAINLNHQQCVRHSVYSVARGILCGLQLLEAKRNVPHGHFGKIWDETDFSERTGQNYMAVAKSVKTERLGKSATVADLLELPEDQLLEQIAGAVAGESMRQLMVGFNLARPRPEEVRLNNLTGNGATNGGETKRTVIPRRRKQRAVQMLLPIFTKMTSARAVGENEFRTFLLSLDLRADAEDLRKKRNIGLCDLEDELTNQLNEVKAVIAKKR